MSDHKAHDDCECFDCEELIAKGDDVWFCDDGILCEFCADERDIVCPECGAHKKPEYETCYSCKLSAEEAEEDE